MAMTFQEILIAQFNLLEHSDWNDSEYYTPAIMQRLKRATEVVSDYAARHKFEFKFSDHFFDQIKKERGIGNITTQGLLDACGAIFDHGLLRFNNKENGTAFAFCHSRDSSYVTIGVRKIDSNRFLAGTIVRDVRWLGKEQKILI